MNGRKNPERKTRNKFKTKHLNQTRGFSESTILIFDLFKPFFIEEKGCEWVLINFAYSQSQNHFEGVIMILCKIYSVYKDDEMMIRRRKKSCPKRGTRTKYL